MADFSQYGGVSKEWLAVAAKIIPDPKFANVDEMKIAANGYRERQSAQEMKTLSAQVVIKDHSVLSRDGYVLEARSYRSSSIPASEVLPVYLFFHGGGFLFGTISSDDANCSRVAISNAVVVFTVNYRHTPDFAYPCAWDDADDAFEWIHAHPQEIGGDPTRIIVGGTSAGGQLAAALALGRNMRKDNRLPPIAGQLLMIPCLLHGDCRQKQFARMKDRNLSSVVENEFAPNLSLKRTEFFNSLLGVKNPDPNDKRLSPGNADPEDVKGLPPTIIAVAGVDPLRDEALLYAQMLSENGVPTNVTLLRGVPHGFRRWGEHLSVSGKWDDIITQGIDWALSKPSADEFEIKVFG